MSFRRVVRKIVQATVIRFYQGPYLRAAIRRTKWLVPLSLRIRIFRLANQSLRVLPEPVPEQVATSEIPQSAYWILLAMEYAKRPADPSSKN